MPKVVKVRFKSKIPHKREIIQTRMCEYKLAPEGPWFSGVAFVDDEGSGDAIFVVTADGRRLATVYDFHLLTHALAYSCNWWKPELP